LHVEYDPFTLRQNTLKFFESGFRPVANLAFRIDHTMPWNRMVVTQRCPPQPSAFLIASEVSALLRPADRKAAVSGSSTCRPEL